MSLNGALAYELGSWLCAAGILLLIYLTISIADFREVAFESMCLSAQATWFIPSTLLVSERTPLTVAAGILLASNALRLLLSGHIPQGAVRLRRLPHTRSRSHETRAKTAKWFILGAMALQFGLVTLWLGQQLAATAWVGAGVAIWTSSALASGLFPRRPKADFRWAALTVLLATLLLAWQLKSGNAAATGEKPGLAETAKTMVQKVARAPAPKTNYKKL